MVIFAGRRSLENDAQITICVPAGSPACYLREGPAYAFSSAPVLASVMLNFS